jgi:hypothetical protein
MSEQLTEETLPQFANRNLSYEESIMRAEPNISPERKAFLLRFHEMEKRLLRGLETGDWT